MLTSSPSFRAVGCQFDDDESPFTAWVVDLLDGHCQEFTGADSSYLDVRVFPNFFFPFLEAYRCAAFVKRVVA